MILAAIDLMQKTHEKLKKPPSTATFFYNIKIHTINFNVKTVWSQQYEFKDAKKPLSLLYRIYCAFRFIVKFNRFSMNPSYGF